MSGWKQECRAQVDHVGLQRQSQRDEERCHDPGWRGLGAGDWCGTHWYVEQVCTSCSLHETHGMLHAEAQATRSATFPSPHPKNTVFRAVDTGDGLSKQPFLE